MQKPVKITMPSFTLGWELEACKKARGWYPDIEVCHDGSVRGDGMEYKIKREVAMQPLRSLQALRSLVADPEIRTDDSCGFHVHVGLGSRRRRGSKWAAAFVSLARLVEKSAFSAVPVSRRTNDRYCRSWRDSNAPTSIIAKDYSGSKYSNPDRYYWINFVEMFRENGIRTVEIRLMGDSKRFLHLWAWMSMCHLMAQSAWRVMLDMSCLTIETQMLEQQFTEIRDGILINTSDRYRAISIATNLAKKAGLADGGKSALRALRSAEMRSTHRSRFSTDMDDAYDRLISQLRIDYDRARNRFQRGEYVVCNETLTGDPNVVQGRVYPVINDGESQGQAGCTQVRLSHGSGWWISNSHIRRATPEEAQRQRERIAALQPAEPRRTSQPATLHPMGEGHLQDHSSPPPPGALSNWHDAYVRTRAAARQNVRVA